MNKAKTPILVRKLSGHFYLFIPKRFCKYNGALQKKNIGFDPTVRTFCTGYYLDGVMTELGQFDISGIYRLFRFIDKLERKWSQSEI